MVDKKELIIFFKKNWHWIILSLILIFGFYLRVYHIDYPVIGYHDWKETHYLTEARNFARDGFFENEIFVPEHDYPSYLTAPESNGAHPDTFPTISILAAIGFDIFGMKLIVARMISVLFNVASIFIIYLIFSSFFKNKKMRKLIALTGAAVTAIMPMLVFFSRNVQLMSTGLFFMLASLLFYLYWIEKQKYKDAVLTAIFLTLAFMTKYPFLVIAIPMFVIFPFKKIKIKDKVKEIVTCAAVFSVGALWFIYSNFILTKILNYGEVPVNFSLIDLLVIFNKDWLQIMKLYIADNYTWTGIIFAAIGLLTLFALKDKKIKKFIVGYVIATILFSMVMGLKMQGHSYHQFPLSFLIIFLISYSFMFIAELSSKIIKTKKIVQNIIKISVICILFLILLFPSIEAKNRQFNTQFIGLDVAGEYIKMHKLPGERESDA